MPLLDTVEDLILSEIKKASDESKGLTPHLVSSSELLLKWAALGLQVHQQREHDKSVNQDEPDTGKPAEKPSIAKTKKDSTYNAPDS